MGHTSHNLSLTEITVNNESVQISREATLRLIAPSPDHLYLPNPTNSVTVKRRLVEIWVDGSCLVSGCPVVRLVRLPIDTL